MSAIKLVSKALELAEFQDEVYRGAIAHLSNNYLQAVMGRLQLGIMTGEGVSVTDCELLLKRSDTHANEIAMLTLTGRNGQ